MIEVKIKNKEGVVVTHPLHKLLYAYPISQELQQWKRSILHGIFVHNKDK